MMASRRVTLGASPSAETNHPSSENYSSKLEVNEELDVGDADYDLNADELEAFSQKFSQNFGGVDVLLREMEESEPPLETGYAAAAKNTDEADHVSEEFDDFLCNLDESELSKLEDAEECISKPSDVPTQAPKRPRTESRQPKITDYNFLTNAPRKRASLEKQLDPEKQRICKTKDKDGKPKDTLFQLNETWISLKNEKLAGIYFTLQSFHTNRRKGFREEASCGNRIFIRLEKTFIGVEESKRLCSMEEWKHSRRDCEFAICANKTGFTETGTGRVPLTSLHHRVKRDPPEPSLVWDCGLKEGYGAGYNCAYRDALPDNTRERELPRKPVVLELFAGGGGMSTGFTEAGFEVRYMVENDPAAAATLRCNHQGVVFEEDVDFFLKSCEDGRASCYPSRGDVDHIHASPPCQGFSSANRSRNNGRFSAADLKNNEHTYRIVKAVKIYHPRTVSMENVTGILHEKKQNLRYLQRVVADLLLLGYQVRVTILDASDYGDPQRRERVILLAAKIGCKLPDAPAPTHGAKNGLPPVVEGKDVLESLVSIAPSDGNGIVQLANGAIVFDHCSQGTEIPIARKNDGGQDDNNTVQELAADGPVCTLRKENKIKHHAHHRYITVRERARLQSFPDDYKFCGKVADKCHQIGNAVPVKLATAIAKSIMASHKVSLN